MRDIIALKFDQAIDQIFKEQPQIIPFIKHHERKNMCIDNLCAQMNLQPMFDRRNVEYVVTEMVKLFSKAALIEKEQQLISQSERKRLESIASHEKDLAAQCDEILKGD